MQEHHLGDQLIAVQTLGQPVHFLPQALDLLLLPVDGALFLPAAFAPVEVYWHGRSASSSGCFQAGAALLCNRWATWRHSGYT